MPHRKRDEIVKGWYSEGFGKGFGDLELSNSSRNYLFTTLYSNIQ